MPKEFKYKTTFSDVVTASGDIDSPLINISKASLDSLKSIIPEDVDLDKNIDLMAVAFNAAVVNKFNRNGDGIDSEAAVKIKDQFKHKPTNIEHQKQKVVGHIISASFSKKEDNAIMTDEEALATEKPFNIALASLIYKSVNPEFANLVQNSVDPESDLYNQVSASWEIGFNDFVLAIGADEIDRCKIIEDEEQINELKANLKAFGGNGKLDDGSPIHRLIVGEIYPLGIGFTSNPAADVQGLTVGPEDTNSIKEEKVEKNISQIHISDVITKKHTIMDNNDILNNLVSALEEKVSNKKFSEEAVATVSKIINDAILEKNDSFVKEKEALESEKAELSKAAEQTAEEIQKLREELNAAKEQVSALELKDKEQEAIATFDSRMSLVEDIYQLDDESRKVVANELKDLDSSEESFAQFQDKLQIVLKHQNKEFIENQQEEFNTKLAEAVEKRIQELSSDSASEEEVVEDAIDNAETNEEQVIANNNAEVSEEEQSLTEKFRKAFSEDNLTINY